MSRTEQIIATAIEFMDFLSVVPQLQKILGGAKCQTFQEMKSVIDNPKFQMIQEKLESKIATDVTLSGCGSLRYGIELSIFSLLSGEKKI